jgi:heat shock protein HtpX
MANQIKTIMLMGCLGVLIVFMGQVIGGQGGLVIALVIAVVTNMGVYWFSANMVLAQTGAKVVDRNEAPGLYQLVEHLAQRAELPMPKVAIVEDPTPNAFATGRNPSHAVVAVTRGLLNTMNREELAGVLGHELAHVKHRDILIGSVAAVMASVIMFLASMAKFGALFGGRRNRGGIANVIPAILMALLAPLAACLIQAAISRKREYLADQGGADIAGSSRGLISALSKLEAGQTQRQLARANPSTASLFIVNPLSAQTFKSLFSTHPPTQDRIRHLMTMN